MTVSAKPVFISASRADTFQNCSQLYAAKYIWKLPDSGNDGANRGSVAHDTLEILANPRHHAIYTAAVLHDTCMEVPALWRLIRRFARHYGVDDPANLDMIDDFILVALKSDFHGPAGTFESFAEKAFELHVEKPDGRKFSIRGFIDRGFKVRGQSGVTLILRDYKGSKEVFKGDKASFNWQTLIYLVAARILYPDISRREFHFLFMRFPKKARLEQPAFTEDELNGFEWMLTDLQRAIEDFTLENASDNLADDDPERQWLCGREGTKKDGTKNWICGARLPMDYWVVVGQDGGIVGSGFTETELKPKEVQKVEKRRYTGCPRYFNPQTGMRRNFQ